MYENAIENPNLFKSEIDVSLCLSRPLYTVDMRKCKRFCVHGFIQSHVQNT